MSIRYCSSCGHANAPSKGVLAKTCQKCGNSLESKCLSSLVGGVASPQKPSEPTRNGFKLSSWQEKIINKRTNDFAGRNEIDEDSVSDGDFRDDEDNLDIENIQIKVQATHQEKGPIKLGGLFESKVGRTILPERGAGDFSKESLKKTLEKLKSSKGSPSDII